MKKFPLKFALVLVTGATLFFACKKEEKVAQVATVDCATLTTAILSDVTAYQNALTTYSTAPTVANCNAVKSSITVIINKIKECPQFAPMKTQYDEFLKLYTCSDR